MRKSRDSFVLVFTAAVAAVAFTVPAAGSISDHFVHFLLCWRVPPCSAVLLLFRAAELKLGAWSS